MINEREEERRGALGMGVGGGLKEGLTFETDINQHRILRVHHFCGLPVYNAICSDIVATTGCPLQNDKGEVGEKGGRDGWCGSGRN